MADINVVLQDVNDNPPIFSTEIYECFVSFLDVDDGRKLHDRLGNDCQVEVCISSVSFVIPGILGVIHVIPVITGIKVKNWNV